jgi:putative addiction module CopG family antidote
MKLQLSPELERFVDQQVRAGKFSSADQVVEAGLARLMLDPEPEKLSDAEAEQVRTALEQMSRGDMTDWKSHAAATRKRFGL